MVRCSLFSIIIWWSILLFVLFGLSSISWKYIVESCHSHVHVHVPILYFISYFIIHTCLFDYSTQSNTICWISSWRKFIDFISIRFLTKLLSAAWLLTKHTKIWKATTTKNMEQQIRFIVNESLQKHTLVTGLSFYYYGREVKL